MMWRLPNRHLGQTLKLAIKSVNMLPGATVEQHKYTQDKSWFSSAPPSKPPPPQNKRAMFLIKYSVLGNKWNACIFLMIWHFRSPSSFFFFLMRTKTCIFQFKKKITLPRHFSNFVLMWTKTFIFHGLTIDNVQRCQAEATHICQNYICNILTIISRASAMSDTMLPGWLFNVLEALFCLLKVKALGQAICVYH